jgi:hypothetical protein
MMVHQQNPQIDNLRLNLVDSYQAIVIAHIPQWGDLDI